MLGHPVHVNSWNFVYILTKQWNLPSIWRFFSSKNFKILKYLFFSEKRWHPTCPIWHHGLMWSRRKNRETLFTFKLQSTELLSFWRDISHKIQNYNFTKVMKNSWNFVYILVPQFLQFDDLFQRTFKIVIFSWPCQRPFLTVIITPIIYFETLT